MSNFQKCDNKIFKKSSSFQKNIKHFSKWGYGVQKWVINQNFYILLLKFWNFGHFWTLQPPRLIFLTFVFETTCFSEDFGIKILKIGLKLSSQWFLIFFVFYEENGDFSYFSTKMAYISEIIIVRKFNFFYFLDLFTC